MSHIFLIKEALSRNELIVMHGDRYMDQSSAVKMTFMGRSAYFPTGPFFIAAKFNIPISFAFAMKETQTHYHFYASKPLTYKLKGNREEKNKVITALMQKYIQELENIITKHPYQWFNFYDFWDIKNK